MPTAHGRTIPLSPARRFVADVMHFSRSVPLVAVERTAAIPAAVLARDAAAPRPGWPAVFLKAFGLAARDVPDLRRSYLSFPWPRLYEHPFTVPAVTVERADDGGPAVFVLPVRHPETTPLAEIDAALKRAKTAPVRDVAAFRRMRRLARLPTPVRRFVWWLGLRAVPAWRQRHFGTVAVGCVVPAGAEITAAMTPLTGYLTFGEVGTDGRVTVRLLFDHRVLDAAQAARYLVAVERALNEEIVAELRSRSAAAA